MPDSGRQPDREQLGLHLLVLRCQTGDERAFASLFERFRERTMRHLRGLVDDDAEDVQQEVWLAVYRGLAGLADPTAFRTWLFQTTRHRAMDHLRRRRRSKRLLELVTAEADVDAEVPDDTVTRLHDFDLMATADGLSPVQREVLLLRYQNDLSYAEIALVTGCSIGTVRSRLHHARLRMKDIITQGRTP